LWISKKKNLFILPAGANPMKRLLEKNAIFCLSYASFSMHKLERRILRQNLRQKMSFGVILSQENSFIGLK
jgi:hypothetical protein